MENDTSRQAGQFRWPQSRHFALTIDQSSRLAISSPHCLFSRIAALVQLNGHDTLGCKLPASATCIQLLLNQLKAARKFLYYTKNRSVKLTACWFLDSLTKGEWCKAQKWDPGDTVRDFNEKILERRRCLSRFISREGDFDKRDTSMQVLTKRTEEITGQNLVFAQFPTTRAGFLHNRRNRSL
jgi:hypothetical protein